MDKATVIEELYSILNILNGFATMANRDKAIYRVRNLIKHCKEHTTRRKEKMISNTTPINFCDRCVGKPDDMCPDCDKCLHQCDCQPYDTCYPFGAVKKGN